MTTPNGQHHEDPNGSSQQATSTVLALDGWGPVIAEPSSNGSNGSEPEAAFEEPTIEELAASERSDWRESIQAGWNQRVAGATIDPQLIRLLAPLAAMAVAVIAALKLSDLYLQSQVSEPDPVPPSRASMLRRSLALAIDPSLTPVEPPPPVWERWLGQVLR